MDSIPSEVSDFIELLCITDKNPIWWKYLVLDVFKLNKGSKIRRGTMRYEPGPDVHTEYNVFFFT